MADRVGALARLEALADELTKRGDSALADEARAALADLRATDAPTDLLSSSEAAALLGVRSINTVKRWAREGSLEGFQVGGRVKVSRASVERLLASAMVACEQAHERELAEVLDAFDAGDEPLPPSDLVHRGRAPWAGVDARRP